eukprot:TRINITY_DN55259_c0_g1_i1.p1 TRINITY_DN55259_c0_g1~~TRINITY_DN55259_c0_g1_i1.p1  ORF type:complete len:651 (+),score=126.52 TRINITY_DN55259_c0_g1_i1:90-2042(+)
MVQFACNSFVAAAQGMSLVVDPSTKKKHVQFSVSISAPLDEFLHELQALQKGETSSTGSQRGMAPNRTKGIREICDSAGAPPGASRSPAALEKTAAEKTPGALDNGSPQHTGEAKVTTRIPPGFGPPPAPGQTTLGSQRSGPAAASANRSSGGHLAVPPAPAQAQGVADAALLDRLHASINAGKLEEVYASLSSVSELDLEGLLGAPESSGLLHRVLLRDGSIEMLSLLLASKCDPNASDAVGTTPLHVAVGRHAQLPLVYLQLLLSHSADPSQANKKGVTPITSARDLAAVDRSAMQLHAELTERPTLAVCVVGGAVGLNAKFGNNSGDTVIFYDQSVVGSFDVATSKTVSKMELSSSDDRQGGTVASVAVNPSTGLIAVLVLKGKSANDMLSLVIVWRSGALDSEEPLKMSCVDKFSGTAMAQVTPTLLSTTTAFSPSRLVAQLPNGTVVHWRLNDTCSQVEQEDVLGRCSGPVDVSWDGVWMAMLETPPHADMGSEATCDVSAWMCDSALGRFRRIAALERRPKYHTVRVSSDRQDGSGVLVLLPGVGAAGAVAEVFTVSMNGAVETKCSVSFEAPCRSLTFTGDSADTIAVGLENGQLAVYDLVRGRKRVYRDPQPLKDMCLSLDGRRLLTIADKYVKVVKVQGET